MTSRHGPALLIASVMATTGCDRAASRGGAGANRTVRVAASRGDVAPRVVLTGDVRAANAVEITTPRTDSWELSIRWMAEDGAAVKAGDRVLEFDNSAFTSQLEQKKLLLRQAEMDLRSTRDLGAVSVADKEAELREKRVTLDKARVLAAVPAELLAGRTAQERQLEQKRAEAAVAATELDLAAARKAGALDLRVKQIELDKARRAIDDANRAMAELVIAAPRDGVIVVGEHPWEGRKLHTGDSAQPGWTVLTLPDPNAGLEVKAELSDVDDGKVAVGMVGGCALDAFPDEPQPCTVVAITPVARSKSRQSLRKAFDVTLSLVPRAGQEVRPGMSVKIELRSPPVTDAVVVPRGAVRVVATGATVRVPGGERRVELGPCDAQRCAVTAGLAAGDTVEFGGAP